MSELRKIATLVAVLALALCIRVNAAHSIDPHDGDWCAKVGCQVNYDFSLSLKLPWNKW
jgi:hypothetical protein